MESFWRKLPTSFFALAPLADVTDPAYRRLIGEYGAPHVMYTEFVSADGLYHTREKKGMKDEENPLVRDFGYTEGERPILAQIFGSNPETIEYAAALAAQMGFDGIDLNMGCPDRSIEKQGAGAGMIKTPELVAPIMEAARRGAATGKNGALPVSIKTRIGYHREAMDEWLPIVLATKPDALAVHLRTRKEMSKVDAHWELMARAVALRDAHSPETIILGNGDVKDCADARAKAAQTGADGIMLGRAIFGNPWLFTDRAPEGISPLERIDALALLAHYFGELRPAKSFHLLKKHFKSFITGWEGAAQTRAKLMEASSLEDLTAILQVERALL
jgi:tRNA-dihydrouridine synthase